MQLIQVLAVIVMFAVLMFAVFKKFNPAMTLLFIGLITISIMMLITGSSVMGKSTSGSMIIDVFEFISSKFVAQVSGTGLIIMVTMGFVMYMEHIKATNMFAALASKPLQKIKSPYVVVAGALVVICVIDMFVVSASSRAALYIATIYPVLISVGVSKKTSAATILFGAGCFNFGPINTLMVTALGLGKSGLTIAEHFMKNELKIIWIAAIVVIIVFCLVQKYFDSKEKDVSVAEKKEVLDPKSLGVPYWYAIFPMIPLILVIIFSSLVISSIKISILAAMFIGFIAAFIINLLVTKGGKKETYNDGQKFYDGMGQSFAKIVSLLICASIFSAALDLVGGLSVIVKAISGSSGSGAGLYIAGAVIAAMYFVSIVVTGSGNANIPIFASMLASMANGQTFAQLVAMLTMGGSYGSVMSPVAGLTIIVTSFTNIEIPQLIKRNAIPAIVGMATTIIASIILL